jgi:thiamine pyrophosphokinase
MYDIVVCADSGYERLMPGRRPDYLVGDMDSIPPHMLEEARRMGVRTIVHPVDKDLSDGEAALMLAIAEGADDVTIEGTLGDRSDHLLSTFQLLHAVPRGTDCRLRLGSDMIFLVREGETRVLHGPNRIISVVPSCEGAMVSTRGMRYELDRELLPLGSTRGIHNEPTQDDPSLTVHSGAAFLVVSRP